MAEKLLKDHRSGTEILSAIADSQLGTNTVARRVRAMSAGVGHAWFLMTSPLQKSA